MRREVGLALLLAACGQAAPTPTCPAATHADAARTAAIEARLATVPAGQELIALRDRVAAVCWGDPSSASVITTERVALMASGLEEGEAAARLGHLLVHVRDGLPIEAIPAHAADCDAAVDRALRLEARAYVIEIALQDALGARPTVLAFAFASDVRAAPSDEAREAIVLRYLLAHPGGGPGIDGLADAYRARCR